MAELVNPVECDSKILPQGDVSMQRSFAEQPSFQQVDAAINDGLQTQDSTNAKL